MLRTSKGDWSGVQGALQVATVTEKGRLTYGRRVGLGLDLVGSNVIGNFRLYIPNHEL